MRWVILLVATLISLLSVASPAAAQMPSAGPSASAPSDEGQRLLQIAALSGTFRLIPPVAPGYALELLEGNEARGTVHVGLVENTPALTRPHSKHYTLSIWSGSIEPSVTGPLVRAANAIIEADGGLQPGKVRLQGFDPQQMYYTTGGVVIVALAMALWRRGRIQFDLRKAHVVQALVHSSIFAYWSIYWPGVGQQLPMILLMIVMAFAADAACCFAKFGSWRLGFGPLPVVFSTNLFVWLDWRGATLAMVGAFVCKTFVQREGRHIFNPSVAGLTLNALCTVLFPDVVHFGGLFHTLNMAPNMSEWVFLGSLIPLVMFRLLPVSLGAVIGLFYFTQTPGALRPTLLLMMTLLATDPATTPRSDLGRFVFGLLVGLSYPIYSRLLHALGQPDDFAKILSVPLANVLAPWLDRITGAVQAWVKRAELAMAAAGKRVTPLRAVPNHWLVVCWVALYCIGLRAEKPQDFEGLLHWTWGTPLVVFDPNDVPRCEQNPTFCEPFAFVSEARAWLSKSP
jgi:hypothetical protein